MSPCASSRTNGSGHNTLPRPMSQPNGHDYPNMTSIRLELKKKRSKKTLNGSQDPLAMVLAPPHDETPEERALRIKTEEKAKKLSEDIDKYLKRDGEDAAKKRTATVRLLLLGQSESGKSTALKNFQLLYNPQSFQAERLAWRLVIIFNLVHSIRVLHHIVSDALAQQQQDEEEANCRDTSLGQSPTSPLFSRGPLSDFQDLLPPPDPTYNANSRNHLSLNVNLPNAPVSPSLSPTGGADRDPDFTDAASSHSAGSSSNAPKASLGRRSSLFSTSMLDKKRSPERRRPSTLGSTSPASPNLPNASKTSPPVTKLRMGTTSGSEDEAKRPRVSALHKSRSRDSLSSGSIGLVPNFRSWAAGSELYPGPFTPQEIRPKVSQVAAHSLPRLQKYPDLKWTTQHSLLLMRLKPLLNIEFDLLRRLSVPEEDEAVRLDFNLPEMRKTAVRVAISGRTEGRDGNTSIQSSRENGNPSRSGQSISIDGRPRAKSSVDLHTLKASSKALSQDAINTPGPLFASASSLSAERPVPTLRKSDDMAGRISNNVVFNNGHVGTSARVLVPSGNGVVIPEFFVRSTINWKEKLRKLSKYDPVGQFAKGGKGDGSREWNPWDDEMDPAHFIHACSRDVIGLWNDPVVQEYLTRNKYKMEHSPGFFLSDVERITARDYIPTNDDILRARIKTIGVTEHQLVVNTGGSVPKEWLVYDVGGSRTQRAAWLPYFDTTDAIIFIASLSSFDQVLAEDPNVNRMEDSLRLFRTIVDSPILKDVNIILLLNKMDLLNAKLQSGIQVVQYFKRYGDRPNTAEAVTKFFRNMFITVFERRSSPSRVLTIHTTSLTDPKSTRFILEAVTETIIKGHMRRQWMV